MKSKIYIKIVVKYENMVNWNELFLKDIFRIKEFFVKIEVYDDNMNKVNIEGVK